MEGLMPKATRLAHRLAREDAIKGRSSPGGQVPTTAEEIIAGATIVAAMLQTGKLPAPDPRGDFMEIAEAVAKCATAVAEARQKPRHPRS
jgi:hypothetical protein